MAWDGVVDAMAAAVEETDPQLLLSAGIAETYERTSGRLAEAPNVATVARGDSAEGRDSPSRRCCSPCPPRKCRARVTEESFGPVTVVVRYDGVYELFHSLSELPPSLTTEAAARRRPPRRV